MERRNQSISGVIVAVVFFVGLAGLMSGCLLPNVGCGDCLPGCTVSADCSAGAECNKEGRCVNLKPPPVSCSLHSECTSTEICGIENFCELATPCLSTEECGSGERCNQNEVCLSPPPGPDGSALTICLGFCEKTVEVFCQADQDCSEGEFCDFLRPPGDENAPGTATLAVESGTCQLRPAPPCRSHDDCVDGLYCAENPAAEGPSKSTPGEPTQRTEVGHCEMLEAGTCLSDQDCQATFACQLSPQGTAVGACLKVLEPCHENEDCGEGEECTFDDALSVSPSNYPVTGHCEATEPTMCWGDLDCGTGEYCDFELGLWNGLDETACEGHEAAPMPGQCAPDNQGPQ